jgi:hypothetical protein
MRDTWLTGKHEVKSLHPKLSGRVRLSRRDAEALIWLFLTKWHYEPGDSHADEEGYIAFPSKEITELQRAVIAVIFAGQDGSGLLLPVRVNEVATEAILRGSDEVFRLYLESDAAFALSRHNTAIGTTPIESMRNFWHILKDLYDESTENEAFIVWIVDIGSRQVEDEEAWREFFNFEMLKSQFRAFATFDSTDDDVDKLLEGNLASTSNDRSALHDAFLRHLTIPERQYRDKRWLWLCEKSVFAVQNLRLEEFDDLYQEEDKISKKFRLKDIGVTAEHILPNEFPYAWARQKDILDLYRGRTKKMADATITVFLDVKRSGVQSIPNCSPTLRYFAHAPISDQYGGEIRQWSSSAISREVISPGPLYDEAYRIVYWAARHRLQLTENKDTTERENGAIALAYLAKLGFRMLRLPEFLKIHRTPNG